MLLQCWIFANFEMFEQYRKSFLVSGFILPCSDIADITVFVWLFMLL